MASVNQIEKALAGLEDLLVGTGAVVQQRAGQQVTITKLNAGNIPFSGDAATGNLITILEKINSIVLGTDITIHLADLNNPHAVTAAQVGLGQVDNTTDMAKPVSNAQNLLFVLKENKSNKNVANGYAGLDGAGKLPLTRIPVLQGLTEKVNVIASTAATTAIDFAVGYLHAVTLTSNTTFTFANVTTGVSVSFTMELSQDATGNRVVTWPASVRWPGGVVPSLSLLSSSINVLNFYTRDGGATWNGFVAGADMQ